MLIDPANLVGDRRMDVDRLFDRLTRAEDNRIRMKRSEMEREAGKLGTLNPLAVISRGYSAVYKDDGSLIKRIDDVSPGDRVKFKTVGGEVACTVDEISRI